MRLDSNLLAHVLTLGLQHVADVGDSCQPLRCEYKCQLYSEFELGLGRPCKGVRARATL